MAAEPLFSAIVDTGDAREGEEQGEPHRDLAGDLRWSRVAESLRLVVVVEEGDKVLSCLAMRGEDRCFYDFPVLKDLRDICGCRPETLDHVRKLEEQRVIQRRIDANRPARSLSYPCR
jgi:hypothetical protein